MATFLDKLSTTAGNDEPNYSILRYGDNLCAEAFCDSVFAQRRLERYKVRRCENLNTPNRPSASPNNASVEGSGTTAD